MKEEVLRDFEDPPKKKAKGTTDNEKAKMVLEKEDNEKQVLTDMVKCYFSYCACKKFVMKGK